MRTNHKYLLPAFLALMFLFVFYGSAGNPSVFAKPMPAPEIDKAIKSDWIIVGRYLGHAPIDLAPDPAFESLYFRGLDATYQVESVLKPSKNHTTSLMSLKRPIHVAYAFQDGSACLAPPHFKLNEKTLPASGSSWILFLEPCQTFNHFSTYRGDYGRLPATSDNLNKVKKLLQSE